MSNEFSCLINSTKVEMSNGWSFQGQSWSSSYGSWTFAICAYHPYSCEFEPGSWRGVLDTTLCDKVCQWLATGRWFSPGTSISSTNKTDRHDASEILLQVALYTINLGVFKLYEITTRKSHYTLWMLILSRHMARFDESLVIKFM